VDEDFRLYMLAFLRRHFPVGKVKKEGSKRFKKGIHISSGFTGKTDRKFSLNDGQELRALYTELFQILTNVFGARPTDINPVLFQHLKIL